DLEGDFAEPLPLLIPNDGLTAPRTQRALAEDEVCYAGEVVAMVVARDRYIGEDAASLVRVDYEPLPVVADLAAAAGPGASIVHFDMTDNVAGRVSEEKGDVDGALAAAPHVFEWQFRVERSASMPLEGRAVVARYDAAEDRLLIHDSTQAPTGVRAGLAMLFGMDPDHVHVVAPDIGGGFGVKVVQFYPEEVLVPWAARKLGVPVKWAEDRREHFIGSTQERGQIHQVRVGVDDEGRILALETRFLHDSGAYPRGLAARLEALDYDRVRGEQAAARAEGRKVGVGIGTYVEGTGIGPYEGAAVSILPDGSVSIATGLSSQGQGHETMLAQIAADELGAPVESVRVVAGDARRMGLGVGTFASRSAVVAGNAVLLAAREVARQAREVAARILQV